MMKKLEPKKQAEEEPPSKKRGGKQDSEPELVNQLDALGLKIVQVTADGNCFFRALADQIEGDEDNHAKYRKKIVRHIKKNRVTFEPFVEDEIPFEEYCQSMIVDGTWAGNMELQAASRVTRSNICIHRHNSQPWYIQNFDKPEVRTIHLSYHHGNHYNSVRSKDDTCCGPARPIVMKDDVGLSEKPDQPIAVDRSEKLDQPIDVDLSEKLGQPIDVDLSEKPDQPIAAVDVVHHEESEKSASKNAGGDAFASDEVVSGSIDLNKDGFPDEHSEQQPELANNGTEKTYRTINLLLDGKQFPRSRLCPCGSQKRYISCCGSTPIKPSGRLPVNQTAKSEKIQKDRKCESRTATSSIQSNGGPSDIDGQRI